MIFSRVSTATAPSEDYLGRVIVGLSSDAFSQRQQEILLKAGILALFALLFTFLIARRLAGSLSQPIRDIGDAVKAIQNGDFKTPCPSSMTPSWAPCHNTSTTSPAASNRPAANSNRQWRN
jgi:HAMP domain-containing protein